MNGGSTCDVLMCLSSVKSSVHKHKHCLPFQPCLAPYLVLLSPRVTVFQEQHIHLYQQATVLWWETRRLSQSELIDQRPGFQSGPDVSWGNLCSCMSTLIAIAGGYRAWFWPRSPAGEPIEWNLQTRGPVGDCKIYDFMGPCPLCSFINLLLFCKFH